MTGVRLTRQEGVLIAAIDRPAIRNAADLEVYDGLRAALREDADAYVLTGGKEAFSAGDDVRMFTFADTAQATDFIIEVTQLFQVVESIPRPVVAAVTGYALGFGFELALACDAAVAAPDARLGLPEAGLGAAPPNALGRGVDVLGRGWIRYLALSPQRWLSGQEAHDLGMIVSLSPADRVLEEAVSLARAFAGAPGFAAGKRLLTQGAEPAYRAVAGFMPPLMASGAVAASAQRFSRTHA